MLRSLIVFLVASSLVNAATPQCSDDDANEQARKLLVFPPESGVIRELTLGDRACYIAIEQDGEISDAMAFMELCERDDLIGQFVTFEHEASEVIAMSCQGDPECTESETVLLISDVAL